MPNVVISPNMGLPVPVVGIEIGPQWADDLNACLSQIDGHNHTPGSGVPVPVAGLSINADLPLQSNNLTMVRSVIFVPQAAPLSGVNDIGSVYVSGLDLYYNDVNGNQVRITQGGSVAGTPGSISGLTPPASVTYQAFDSTFVFQSAVDTPANIDVGAITLRNLTPLSNGITIETPSSLASDYTIILPATLPATMGTLTATSSGSTLWVTQFDAVVGSSAQVAAGLANFSTWAAAISATAANGTIKILRGSWTENVTINKTLIITGSGFGTVLTGDVSIVGANYCILERFKFTGNLSIDAASIGNIVEDCYGSNTSVITDGGTGDLITVILDP